MLEVQNGKAVLWGISGSINIEGYASFILQDGKLDHKFKLTPIEDETDHDATLIATNEHFETTITWIPAGSTRAAALATVTVPDPLQSITMSGFDVDLLNGTWIYIGDATVNVNHAAGKMSLKVRKYADETQNASLSNTVS